MKLNFLQKLFITKTNWNIVVFKANTPFDINKTATSTLMSVDVTDCNARAVADPFLIKKDNMYYLFFEIEIKDKNGKGVIGVATSNNGINFKYEKVILEEEYHLSYPKVYKINDRYYMIPESGANNSIDIYEAKKFPYKWEKIKTILYGDTFADPTLVNYNDIWYLFVTNRQSDKLNIYYSENFFGDYKKHKNDPVYIDNKTISRPAGMVFEYNNSLYRVAQDCSNSYGERLYFFKITDLTPISFQEELIYSVNPTCGVKWNSLHMHHFSFIKDKEQFLIAMDGKGYMYRLAKFIRRFFK